MKRSSDTRTKGYLLIEAMVAMGVLMSGVLGIFALMSQSIKLTRVIDDQYVATYLAAEGVELVKNLLDANASNINSGRPWNALGFASNGCYEVDVFVEELDAAPVVACPDGGVTPLRLSGGSEYQYQAGNSTPYVRTVAIEPIGTVGVRIVSTVKWRGGSSSVSLEDKFYNWH